MYRCNKCGYQVSASGGHDFGMMAVTDTYICTSCEEIVDVTVGEQGNTFTKEDIQSGMNKILEASDFYKCPLCGSDKYLVLWDNNLRPCPKCDGKMEKVSDEGVAFWD